MAREIPDGAVEIQTGLWLYTYTKTITGLGERTYRELYSSDGYCFYNHTWAEDERIYWQYASLGSLTNVNDYTSIPISELPEGSEIAGNPNKPEIA